MIKGSEPVFKLPKCQYAACILECIFYLFSEINFSAYSSRYRGKRMRIDYFLVSEQLKDRIISCEMHGRGIELDGMKLKYYHLYWHCYMVHETLEGLIQSNFQFSCLCTYHYLYMISARAWKLGLPRCLNFLCGVEPHTSKTMRLSNVWKYGLNT